MVCRRDAVPSTVAVDPTPDGELDVLRDLQSHERRHRLVRRQRQRVVERLPAVGPVALIGEVHRWLVDGEAEHPVRASASRVAVYSFLDAASRCCPCLESSV